MTEAASSPGRRFPRGSLLLAIGLASIVLALYARSTGFGFVLTDDPIYVTENPRVLAGPTPASLAWALTTFEASNWHPLTWASLMLDARIGGGAAWAFHATNVALHAANTVLLFLVLLFLTRAPWKCAVIAALFGVHPLHVESVAWVVERKDLLSALFGLLAISAWVSYVRRPGAWRYALALALFALGLSAKPMLVTLPFVLLLFDYWPLARTRTTPRKRRIVEKLPFLALAAVSCWVTLRAQQGVVGSLEHFPLGLRVENAILACAVYLRRMVWPSDLAMPYPYDHSIDPLALVGSIALLVSITALVVWQRRERYLAVGWLWYLGTLVPVAGLVQVGTQPMADRYTYLPLVGPFVMLAFGLPRLLGIEKTEGVEPNRGNGWRSVALASGTGLALLAFSIATWGQLEHWRGSRSLFLRALAVTEQNVLAHNGIATVMTLDGQTDEAIAHYRESLRIHPGAEYARLKLSGLLVATGRIEEAAALYEALLAASPDSVVGRVNYAGLLMRLGKHERAAEIYRRLLETSPEDPELHRNLGLALVALGRTDEASQQLETSLDLAPGSAEAHMALGNILARRGDPAAAVEHYRRATEHAPDDARAHLNLSIALMQQNRLGEARDALERALELDPRHAVAHKRMGVLLYREGKLAEAIGEFEESLRLDPVQTDLERDLAKLREIAAGAK